MKKYSPLSILIGFAILTLCGCGSLVFGPAPVNKTPSDIYTAEAKNSRSRWYYVGTKGEWHYFQHYAPVFEPDWKIQQGLLPDLEGYRYYFAGEKRKLTPTDVKIHKKFIQTHIDGHPPYKIPFESRGYISPDDQPQWKWLKESDLQAMFNGNSDDPNRVKATILEDGTIEIEEAKKRGERHSTNPRQQDQNEPLD